MDMFKHFVSKIDQQDKKLDTLRAENDNSKNAAFPGFVNKYL